MYLRRLRINAGISQNLAAKLAGVDAAYVNRLERLPEIGRPSPAVLDGLVTATGASEDEAEMLRVLAGVCPVFLQGRDIEYIDAIMRLKDLSPRQLRAIATLLEDT